MTDRDDGGDSCGGTGASRRRVLAGAASASIATALAGCSFSLGGSGYDRAALSEVAEGPDPSRPATHPVEIDEAMIADHREHARDHLEQVSDDPSLPNGVVADELASNRERVAETLRVQGPSDADGGEPSDDGSGSGETDDRSAEHRLHDARDVRADAADLHFQYLAATGDVTERELERLRDDARDRLAGFRRAWAYRAPSPTRALLVHALFEGLVERVEVDLAPWPRFPDDPLAGWREVGHLRGKVATADALLDDLDAYREQVATADAGRYRPALAAAAMWLSRRANRVEYRDDRALEDGRAGLSTDPGDSVAGYGFDVAREYLREYSKRAFNDVQHDSQYARTALFAAKRRAAVDAFAAAVDDAESSGGSVDVSASTVADERTRAVDAIEQTLDAGPTGLQRRLLEPAYVALRDGDGELRTGRNSDPRRAFAVYRYVARYADAATRASEELVGLLRAAE
ncbi:hypothetical protein [Halorubellus salinus]|uniref:hypothetical protein n=1 Tax=Halorubellus salinus TaxID=755309 RepID=UPI001D062370|nr:hypothetical protein [Halorubellus salinus]